jgi:hypothetical protein
VPLHRCVQSGLWGRVSIGLEHRCFGFLELQENRVAVACEEKRDTTVGADAADADDLDRHIAEGKAIEERADVLGQRLGLTRKHHRAAFKGAT